MIRLLTSYYNEPNRKRLAEIRQTLLNNYLNTAIDEIVVLYELRYGEASHNVGLPIKDEKINYIFGRNRPFFSNFFRLINQKVKSEEEISIIANSDIFFDSTITLINDMSENGCYALSRWEINDDGSEGGLIQNRGDSQDVFCFKGQVQTLKNCDFSQGLYGCDNRLCHEIKKAGYNITNPCFDVKTWHLHNSGIRNYGAVRNEKNTVPPPYHIVKPSKLKTA